MDTYAVNQWNPSSDEDHWTGRSEPLVMVPVEILNKKIGWPRRTLPVVRNAMMWDVYAGVEVEALIFGTIHMDVLAAALWSEYIHQKGLS